MSPAASTSGSLDTAAGQLPSLEQLPNDPAILKHLLLEVLATLHEERRDKEQMRHRIELLLRRLYGPRTERFDPSQPSLFADPASTPVSAPPVSPDPEPAEPPAAEDEAGESPRRRCKPHGRRPLPENLPRRPCHHVLTEAERLCACGQLRIDIGVDRSEQLDWQPASLFVWEHLVHKYACPACAKKAAQATPTPAASVDPAVPAPELATATAAESPAIATAEPPLGPVVIAARKPAMPIARGLPGAGLLADLIVNKYDDHLPAYRQERRYARQGVDLCRSTLCDWLAACAETLRPLYEKMIEQLLLSCWLHTDDTPVKNQRPSKEATATARLWAYLGDRFHPYNVFDFTATRKRDGPQQFLAHFAGYLHADAFSGYDALFLPRPLAGQAGIVEVACNAHARRKFHEARSSATLGAHRALAYYGQLYELERQAKDWDDATRLRMRQDLAVPILEQFKTWLEAQRVQVLPKSPMAEAIGYALNNWTALTRYTEAGFLAIDNNAAEREMKRIAIGRKNWLFVGSEQGGRTAAVLFSFTSTCRRLQVEPWAYLQDVLTSLPTTPAERLGELLPDRWQAARAAQAPAEPAGETPGPLSGN